MTTDPVSWQLLTLRAPTAMLIHRLIDHGDLTDLTIIRHTVNVATMGSPYPTVVPGRIEVRWQGQPVSRRTLASLAATTLTTDEEREQYATRIRQALRDDPY